MSVWNPKVSIILPTFNGSRYIKESLDSIRTQSMRDFECIIVDDASTDNTFDIVSEYIKMDYRFKLIRNEANKQLPESLNVGFRNANGKYLTWTSDDNIYLTDAIGEMCKYLEDNDKSMMVCASMLNIDEGGHFLYEGNKYDDKKMMIGNAVGACFMYRRKVIEEVGEYDDAWRLVEDYEYWIRIIKKYGSIGFLDKYLYLYRRHKDSLTETRKRDIKNKHCELILRELGWLLSRVRNDKVLITELYEMLIMNGFLIDSARNEFISLMPELQGICKISDEKPLILYGAGKVCDKALSEISHDTIAYIVDRSPKKYNNRKNGIEIISLDSLVRKRGDYQVLITVGNRILPEVMRDLMNAGIKRYCPYSCYMRGE